LRAYFKNQLASEYLSNFICYASSSESNFNRLIIAQERYFAMFGNICPKCEERALNKYFKIKNNQFWFLKNYCLYKSGLSTAIFSKRLKTSKNLSRR